MDLRQLHALLAVAEHRSFVLSTSTTLAIGLAAKNSRHPAAGASHGASVARAAHFFTDSPSNAIDGAPSLAPALASVAHRDARRAPSTHRERRSTRVAVAVGAIVIIV